MGVDHSTARGLLEAAYRAVEESRVPEEIREVAFVKAFDFLAGGERAAARSDGHDRERPSEEGAPAPRDTGSRLDGIASTLRLDPDLVGEVFLDEGDKLGISLAARKFESSKKGATRQLALLVAAGRQAGGWDDKWTPADVIREVCSDFGKYDSANFAYTISEMGNVFGFSGTSRARKVKVNRQGYEDAANLVRALAGGGGE